MGTGRVAVAALLGLLACLRRREQVAGAFLVGIVSVCLRLVIASSLAPAAVSAPLDASLEAAWTGDVTSLGATDGGMQRAVVVVRTDDAGDQRHGSHERQPMAHLRVAAALSLGRGG